MNKIYGRRVTFRTTKVSRCWTIQINIGAWNQNSAQGGDIIKMGSAQASKIKNIIYTRCWMCLQALFFWKHCQWGSDEYLDYFEDPKVCMFKRAIKLV